jgi:hypothetical protein
MVRSGTPVQRPLLVNACSGRRLPEHSNPATTSTLFILRRSSIDSDNGLFTIPEIVRR